MENFIRRQVLWNTEESTCELPEEQKQLEEQQGQNQHPKLYASNTSNQSLAVKFKHCPTQMK